MTYNLTRNIPELNSPDQIYQEWQLLSDKPDPSRSSVVKKPSYSLSNNLENAKSEITNDFNEIGAFIASGNSTNVYFSIEFLNERIFEFIFRFSNLSSLKVVRQIFVKPNDAAKVDLNRIKIESEKCLIKLSILKNHTAFLANPKFSRQDYWSILTDIMKDLYNHIFEFIYHIQFFSTKYIPLDTLINSTSMEFDKSLTQSSDTVIPSPQINGQMSIQNSPNVNNTLNFDDTIRKMEKIVNELLFYKDGASYSNHPDKFAKIVMLLCEMNDLEASINYMSDLIKKNDGQLFFELTRLTLNDFESLTKKKISNEKKIIEASQSENAKRFSRHIDEYAVIVQQMCDVFKRCL
ncbi:hypothetical protein TRFO_38376 [Tritrichomonas foetus]|uniref:Uncharacterized protein n=1 Tax=Tritrichomonas foetus TaxID=1144522 RepID=A0A1J4J8J0_9EUKA|nr:hypothetical protein TRFO_38376 [Tritrichomonas foetus]|eukprot:OHS95506.1 hypothetical protein TRFO_38376 [Tritrichomonas foetus]